MHNTFRQEYTPMPLSRCDRYIRQEKLINSPIQTYQYHHNRIDQNMFVQPQSPTLVRDTLDYTKKEKCNMKEDSEVNIDASEHNSDRLCRTAQLIRKSRYNRYNSQSDLTDYATSTSSSVRDPIQMTNPLHE